MEGLPLVRPHQSTSEHSTSPVITTHIFYLNPLSPLMSGVAVSLEPHHERLDFYQGHGTHRKDTLVFLFTVPYLETSRILSTTSQHKITIKSHHQLSHLGGTKAWAPAAQAIAIIAAFIFKLERWL